MPVVLAAVAVGTTVASISQQRKAAKSSQQAAEAEQRRAEIQNVRNVRQSIREARLTQGALVAQGANAGTIGSTGTIGGVASVGAQLGGNLDYLSQIAEENTNIFNATMKATRQSSQAQIYGQVGQLASSAYTGMTGQTIGQTVGAEAKKRGWV